MSPSDPARAPASALPPFTWRAFNYAASSTNRIHADDVARQYGFKGGLVPGVGVYAALCDRLMAPPLDRDFAPRWLARGGLSIQLLKPVYDGETIEVRAAWPGDSEGDRIKLALEVWNRDEVLCARGDACAEAADPPPDPLEYPRAPLPDPDHRRPADWRAFAPGEALGTLRFGDFDPAGENPYFEELRRNRPLLAGPPPLAHPAWLLHQANMLFAANIDLGPWIHTRSRVRHLDLVRWNVELELRARVVSAEERKGHHFLTAEMLASTPAGEPVAAIEHQAIIRPRRATT